MKKSVVLILVLFSACGITDSDSELNELELHEPVTQGIWYVDDSGLTLGEWRSPSASAPTPQSVSFGLRIPYPNPFSNGTTIELQIDSTQQVDIWVLPVRIPEEAESRYVKEFGPESVANGRVATIANTEMDAEYPGYRWASWEPDLPRGFYRIYAESEGDTLWHDVFIGNPGETRNEMLEYLFSLDD